MRLSIRTYFLGLVLALAGLGLGPWLGGVARGAPAQKVVLVAPVTGTIDLGLVPFMERVLQRAADEQASAVIVEIDTFGGRVDAAVAMRDHLLRSKVRSVAFVNKRAISAGALIALATEQIVMARGATIGAAAPVQLGQPGEAAKPAEEKTVSYVRKEFRATADARKRPGLIAEAMVDGDVEIPEVSPKGKLLTLTTAEALEHKVADFEADDLAGALEKLGLGGAELRPVRENWAEQLVRFLTHPVVSSLLMSLGLLGLVVELRTPGFGVPGIVGVLCLASFFWGHWLVALAGWEQLLLLGLGLALIAIEVFFVAGFGVAGVLGIVALLAALGTSLFGEGASAKIIALSASQVVVSAALAAVAFLVLLRFYRFVPGGRRLILESALAGDGRAEEQVLPPGTPGTSLTVLRPAGIALLRERRVDVVSQGELIEADQPIEVVRDEGHRVVVKLRASGEQPSEQKGTS